MKRAATAALLCTILLALYGCRAIKSIEVPVYIHDTTLVRQHVHDSTYIDRWHTEYVNGDTVHVRDSIHIVKCIRNTDTVVRFTEVPVEVKETVEVERSKTAFERIQQTAFWIAVAVLLLYATWTVGKYIVNKLRKQTPQT